MLLKPVQKSFQKHSTLSFNKDTLALLTNSRELLGSIDINDLFSPFKYHFRNSVYRPSWTSWWWRYLKKPTIAFYCSHKKWETLIPIFSPIHSSHVPISKFYEWSTINFPFSLWNTSGFAYAHHLPHDSLVFWHLMWYSKKWNILQNPTYSVGYKKYSLRGIFNLKRIFRYDQPALNLPCSLENFFLVNIISLSYAKKGVANLLISCLNLV